MGKGNNVVIGRNVSIGENCMIGNNVVIHDDTVVGDNVRIDDNTVVGKLPMKSVNSAVTQESDLPPAVIGNNCLIGACTIIYRGSILDKNVLVADQASIRERTKIGEKTIIGRNAYVENDCNVGARCKIQANAYITAFSELGDDVFIAPGVLTSNDNFMGRGKERSKYYKGVTVQAAGRVGLGAVILPNVIVGEDSMVAAGSLLTKDAPSRQIVLGSPARAIKPVPVDQLLENQ